MKFKYFAFFCAVFLLTGLYIIIFERKRSVFVGLVTETHKQFDSLRNFKQDLREASEKLLKVDKKYLESLGFVRQPRLYPESYSRNVTLPVIVSYAKVGEEEQAVSFARSIAALLPQHLTVLYNIGLGTNELFLLQNFCGSNHCIIMNFNVDKYPSHVKGDISLFRPLIIQDALRKYGAVFFIECNLRLTTANLRETFSRAKAQGVLTWQSKLPTTAITHPKMFEYFKAVRENFYFVPAVDPARLIVFNTKSVHENIMYPLIKCILVRSCVLPIGAQNSGCKFDKRPQYRYSGCHLNDASALSIVLGQYFNYSSEVYAMVDDDAMFRKISVEDAKYEISMLTQNHTEKSNTSEIKRVFAFFRTTSPLTIEIATLKDCFKCLILRVFCESICVFCRLVKKEILKIRTK